MKAFLAHVRAKGIPTLIGAALFIVVIMGGNLYKDYRQDQENARLLMESKLRIANQDIMWELYDVKMAIDELGQKVSEQLNRPDNMYGIAEETIEMSTFIKAVFIAFSPNYYPSKGRWFQPRCIRHDSLLVREQGGRKTHDYFKQKWYRDVDGDILCRPKWTPPYVDHSQHNAIVMTLSKPVYDKKGKMAAVIGIDVSLQTLQKLLKGIEPYAGSACQLLDSEGHMLVSTDDTNYSPERFLIATTTLTPSNSTSSEMVDSTNNLQVRLAIPKRAVFGPAIRQNLISLALMITGLLMLAFIIQRSLHNLFILNKTREQQQIIEGEMRIAHDIQMNMLRQNFPPSLHAALIPMKEVGGDLYDFYQKDDALYFIIGDVSGKGLPAAMVMAGTVATFRIASRHLDTPLEIVSEINSVISERNPNLIFITAFVGKLDTRHGLLTFCNAGHNPPVLNGQLLETDPDIPIGYDANYVFSQHGALFTQGSLLVMYTDGITEARNTKRQFMGTKRLMSAVSELSKEDVGSLTEAIISETCKFMGPAEQRDDMTLMCIRNDAAAQSPAIIINNDVEEISRLKPLIRDYCECMGCSRQNTGKIRLAIEEAVVNVINYAYQKGELGTIWIDMQAQPATDELHKGRLTFIITDSGKPFNPLAQQAVDVEQAINDRQTGGLGIYLYQHIMDKVTYERTDDGRNVLTLIKEIGS